MDPFFSFKHLYKRYVCLRQGELRGADHLSQEPGLPEGRDGVPEDVRAVRAGDGVRLGRADGWLRV